MLDSRMALSTITERAGEVAKAVTTLTTALIKEGMPQVEARQEARSTVTLALLVSENLRLDSVTTTTCPLCGKAEG